MTNEGDVVQAEVVLTCHEERPRIYRKKDDGNGVTGKEEKRKTKEKILRYSKKRYGESWCEGDGCLRQKDVENNDTLWLPLIEMKGRKDKKKKILKKHFNKIVPTDCFACTAHQATQYLKKNY